MMAMGIGSIEPTYGRTPFSKCFWFPPSTAPRRYWLRGRETIIVTVEESLKGAKMPPGAQREKTRSLQRREREREREREFEIAILL